MNEIKKIETTGDFAKFRNLLNSYARFIGTQENSDLMHIIEGALVNLVSSNIGKDYPDDIRVALAGVIGQNVLFVQHNIGYLMRIPYGHGSRAQLNAELLKNKNSAIAEAVKWIIKERSGIQFFFGQENAISEEEATRIIKKLYIDST
jgi:hypothetical protein